MNLQEVLNAQPIDGRMPASIRREFRSSHAGEMGPVWIYYGILCASFDPQVRLFAKEHLGTEREHLQHFEELIHLYRGSLVLPLWITAGFLTGFIPALLGRECVFRTIQTVETFVSEHYQNQIELVKKDRKWAHLVPVLVACREDEIAHRDDAASRFSSKPSPLCRAWLDMVAKGSAIAVEIAKRV